MTELTKINQFLNAEKVAMVGASRDERKFGHHILKELASKGKEVFPVHPEAEYIAGMRCYPELPALPAGVKHLFIALPKEKTLDVLKQAKAHGITHVWIQQKSDSPEAVGFATENGMEVIKGRCILMYSEPVTGFHRFHQTLNKLFGTYAK